MKPLLTWCYSIAALEQFKYQATKRLLLSALEKFEDSGTTQKEDVKKTILPPTLTYTVSIFVVNNHGKQI